MVQGFVRDMSSLGVAAGTEEDIALNVAGRME